MADDPTQWRDELEGVPPLSDDELRRMTALYLRSIDARLSSLEKAVNFTGPVVPAIGAVVFLFLLGFVALEVRPV